MPKVAIFIGSKSDEAHIAPCLQILKQLDIDYFFTISSAHRSAKRTTELVEQLEKDQCQVYICAAGMAAHLAGAVAAQTCKPVIGIPIAASPLQGLDAIFSTLMMPPGFPVATVALDAAGAKNAAWLAAQILALSDPQLKISLLKAREEFAAEVERNAKLIEQRSS